MSSFSKESWSLAFSWDTLRESFQVSAVVVNHVLVLHPSKPVAAGGIKSLNLPGTVLHGIRGCGGARWSRWPNTSIGFEISVRSSERSLCPVSLHEPPSRCPIISVPETRINPHGLLRRERHSDWFRVVEYSYRDVVHQETEAYQIAD